MAADREWLQTRFSLLKQTFQVQMITTSYHMDPVILIKLHSLTTGLAGMTVMLMHCKTGCDSLVRFFFLFL